MTGTPKPLSPNVRKRVLLTLFLVLPFVVLAILMWVLAFQLQKQGKRLGEGNPTPQPVSTNGHPPVPIRVRESCPERIPMSAENQAKLAAIIQRLVEAEDSSVSP